VKDALLGKSSTETSVQPQTQKLLDETLSVIKSFNPQKGIGSLLDQLGKINRKATETLSEKDADAVHARNLYKFFFNPVLVEEHPKMEGTRRVC